MEKPIYIVGHKNPDADAICSAIGYAAFKRANSSGDQHWQAVRCGNSNARIDAILGRLNLSLPPFLGDVTPRLADVMIPAHKALTVSPDTTCAEALEIIDDHDVRALPVLDAERRISGMVSVFKLGEFFVPKPAQTRNMRRVVTSIENITRALKAETLSAADAERVEELYVRVGAMDIRSFGRFTAEEKVAAKQSIIVVGDRWDIQEKSLKIGVRLLVITGDLEVEEDIIQHAREKGINLIVSPYDSATTSWVIRSATRLEGLVESEVQCFKADEPLSEVRRKLATATAPLYAVTDDDGRLEGIFTKSDLLKPVSTQLILVDHNELSQAITGADQVNIVEVVDHHRLGSMHTEQPILFINEPVGATSTIVADQFRREGIRPEPQIAGVLMAGIIADTLHCKGPTTTAKDENLLTWLSEHAEVGRDEMADLIFSSGSVILGSDPEMIITTDCKAYEEAGVRFSVSQVEELGFESFWQRSDAIIEALDTYRKAQDLHFSALMVTDINEQNSLLVLSGPAELIDSIKYPHVQKDRVFDFQNIVSRKKQLIPYFSSLLRQASTV